MIRRQGLTLLEIMAAVFILAVAFLPMIGVIGKSSKDTNVSNSYVFAQTTARNILDNLLDEVKFNSIRVASGDVDGKANVGELFNSDGYEKNSFLTLIGNDIGDSYSRGKLIDGRGITYDITIYVFPILVSSPYNVNTDVTFSFKMRPNYETKAPGWYTYQVGEDTIINGVNAYGNIDVDPKILGAHELGAVPNEGTNGSFCEMKRILLNMTWENRDGIQRSLDLFTFKANLDSEE